MTLSEVGGEIVKLNAEYQRNGAVVYRECLSKEWIQKACLGIQKVQKDPSIKSEYVCYKGGSGAHFTDVGNFNRIEELHDLVMNSPIGKVVSEIVGTKAVTFYHDKVLVRDPHDAFSYGMAPYQMEMSCYPFDGNQGCSVWIPVDQLSLETTPKFVAGSHLWGKAYFPQGFHSEVIPDENCTSRCERVPDIRCMQEAMIMEWNLAPGDVIFYNMKTLVSSNGNVTDHVQRAITAHFFGDDIKFGERAWPISPPIVGNLKIGDHPSKDPVTFPVVYSRS